MPPTPNTLSPSSPSSEPCPPASGVQWPLRPEPSACLAPPTWAARLPGVAHTSFPSSRAASSGIAFPLRLPEGPRSATPVECALGDVLSGPHTRVCILFHILQACAPSGARQGGEEMGGHRNDCDCAPKEKHRRLSGRNAPLPGTTPHFQGDSVVNDTAVPPSPSVGPLRPVEETQRHQGDADRLPSGAVGSEFGESIGLRDEESAQVEQCLGFTKPSVWWDLPSRVAPEPKLG